MPSKRTTLVGVCLLFFIFATLAQAAEFRFYLASQYDWGKNTGFNLGFETVSAQPPCTTEGMRLVFMAGNGQQWFYTIHSRKWTLEHVYSIKAVVNNPKRSVELWVDGKLCEKASGNFTSEGGPMKMNSMTSEFPGPSNFIIVPISMKITSGKKVFFNSVFESGKRSIPNILISPYVSDACGSLEFKPQAGDSLTIETKVKFFGQSRLKNFAPYVDEYFQWRYGDWPGKVKSDADLKQRIKEEQTILEQWPESKAYDRFGGYTQAGWKEKATGFFRLTQQNGFYWLITPEGNPCFYTGLCGVGLDADNRWPPTPVTGRENYFQWLPPRDGPFTDAWMLDAWGEKGVNYVLPITANLIRKYGPDWKQKKNEITYRRMKAWGFSGGGKWARQNPDNIAFAWIPVLGRAGVPNLAGHPDVFDPKVRTVFEKSLAEQAKGYSKNPWLIGLSFGNEDGEMIFIEEIKTILAMKGQAPARQAMIDYAFKTLYKGNLSELAKAWNIQNPKSIEDVYTAQASISEHDLDEMRLHYLDEYHKFIYQTIKKNDPNHLYFGFWIPGWRAIWTHPKDWFVVAKHCDVLGYDHYDLDAIRPEFVRFVNEAKKPLLCGEFGWATYHHGTRGFARWHWDIQTGQDAGKLYAKWITDTAKNPYFVGVFLFEHHDESCLGRGPGHGPELQYGEALAWGLVDVTDTPKWDLVKQVREANLRAAPLRLECSRKQPATQPTP